MNQTEVSLDGTSNMKISKFLNESGLNQAINQVKQNSFVKDYKASDEEALGIAISKHFEWSGDKILKTLYYALEDANFHSDNEIVKKIINKYDPSF
jgi:hypothetical protein